MAKKDRIGVHGTDDETGRAPNKKDCAIPSRQFFFDHAQPFVMKIGDTPIVLAPKESKEGSLGWHINEKVTMMIGGRAVRIQCNFGAWVVNSKDLPAEGEVQPPDEAEEGGS